MRFNLKGVSNGTWARLIAMIVVFANLVATTFFDVQLVPFTDAEIYDGASVLVTVLVGIISAWKNNSLTVEAQQADEQLHRLKK